MRYYVVRVEYNTQAQAENRQIYGFDTLDEARKKFHEIMREDINSELLNRALCVIINEHCGTEQKETWYRPDETPEDGE